MRKIILAVILFFTGLEAADMEKATFGAGCFWGVEAAFQKVKGVVSTCVGYSGGTLENPTYKQVCSKQTGHAEVVQLEYDPEQVSYEELLQVFFKIHDPTTFNRQGPDIGSQYRSVIFCHSPEQEEAAKAFIASVHLSRPVVTQVVPAAPFYKAEEYHQKYHEKHGGSCSF